MEKVFSVEGMKCPHCKANVENAIKALNGVTSAVADLEGHNVTVDYDESVISPAEMKSAVADAGRYSLNI